MYICIHHSVYVYICIHHLACMDICIYNLPCMDIWIYHSVCTDICIYHLVCMDICIYPLAFLNICLYHSVCADVCVYHPVCTDICIIHYVCADICIYHSVCLDICIYHSAYLYMNICMYHSVYMNTKLYVLVFASSTITINCAGIKIERWRAEYQTRCIKLYDFQSQTEKLDAAIAEFEVPEDIQPYASEDHKMAMVRASHIVKRVPDMDYEDNRNISKVHMSPSEARIQKYHHKTLSSQVAVFCL